MKKRPVIFTISAVLVLALTGCGTPMYELTEEEADLISGYCANTLAKFNRFQDDGITFVINKTTAEQNAYLGITYNEEEPEPEEEEEEGSQFDGWDGDVNNVDQTGDEVETVDISSVSMGEILGYPDLEISCTSITTAAEYKEGSYILLTPSDGFEYLVIEIGIKNPTDAAVNCDFLMSEPHFIANFPDGNQFQSAGSILLEDFFTFRENIEPGESSRAVALLEIPSSYGDDISGAKLILVVSNEAVELPVTL